MINIAHRLNTIIECDRIIVLDEGKLAEIGKPAELLQKENGLFRQLAINSHEFEELLNKSTKK